MPPIYRQTAIQLDASFKAKLATWKRKSIEWAAEAQGRQETDYAAIEAPPCEPDLEEFKKNRALFEIRFYQKTTEFLLPRTRFEAIVKDIVHSMEGNEAWRVTSQAMDALQTIAESTLVAMFKNAYSITIHTGRATLFVEDLRLLLGIVEDAAKMKGLEKLKTALPAKRPHEACKPPASSSVAKLSRMGVPMNSSPEDITRALEDIAYGRPVRLPLENPHPKSVQHKVKDIFDQEGHGLDSSSNEEYSCSSSSLEEEEDEEEEDEEEEDEEEEVNGQQEARNE